MSAILGVLNLDGQPASLEELGRMNAALLADGPDGGDIWAHGPIGLGQRLMRFTPEDSFEHQPLAGCGGKAMLVADARIDNRRELTETFGLDAADAAVLPDSAFIMKAFEKWGRECVHHLAGDFAFALWDERAQTLFAACSPVGRRPFHYHSAPRCFAFASMARGLHALPGVPRVLNEDKVADFLLRTQRELDATYFKDIRRLRGGHCLTVGPGGLKITQYHQLDLKRRVRFKNDDDYVEAFLELFDRSVAAHLRSATPVAVSMSGGLDSSSIAVTAAGQLKSRGGRLSAYTEVPRAGYVADIKGEGYADETPFVQAIARRHPNIDLNLVRTDGHYFLDDLDSLFDHAEEPIRNATNLVWWEAIRRKGREDGARVMLIGSSGNMTASWYGMNLLQELVREGKWKRALTEARASRPGGTGGSAWRLLAAQGFLNQLPPALLTPLARMRREPGDLTYWNPSWAPINPDFISTGLKEHLRKEANIAAYEQRADMRSLRRRWMMESDWIAASEAGYRSRFGIDTRDPIGDLRIIEFCLAIPEAQFRRDGRTRQLIRRAIKDRLPPEVLENRGRGRQAADWYERQELAKPRIEQELTKMEQHEPSRRMLDVPRLRRLFDTRPGPGGDDDSKKQLDYRTVLETGLMAGRFLRWFEKAS